MPSLILQPTEQGIAGVRSWACCFVLVASSPTAALQAQLLQPPAESPRGGDLPLLQETSETVLGT